MSDAMQRLLRGNLAERRLTDEERRVLVRCLCGWQPEGDWDTINGLLDAALATTEGAHLYMQQYDWDDGNETVLTLLRNPDCDLGTAVMIYWLGGAEYYSQYRDRSEVSVYSRDYYDLVREIEERVAADFYQRRRIGFDPRNHRGCDLTCVYADVIEVKRAIPAYMYTATPGEPVEVTESELMWDAD